MIHDGRGHEAIHGDSFCVFVVGLLFMPAWYAFHEDASGLATLGHITPGARCEAPDGSGLQSVYMHLFCQFGSEKLTLLPCSAPRDALETGEAGGGACVGLSHRPQVRAHRDQGDGLVEEHMMFCCGVPRKCDILMASMDRVQVHVGELELPKG